MSRPAKLVIGVLALAAAGGTAFFWTTRGEAERAPQIAAVAAGPVGVGALGRVEPASRILRLAAAPSQEGARIERLMVVEGERVEAGQVLAEFSDAALRDAALRQAEAQLAQAPARL